MIFNKCMGSNAVLGVLISRGFSKITSWGDVRIVFKIQQLNGMKISNYTIFLLLLATLMFLPGAGAQCCLKTLLNSKKCASCPDGSHLFKGNCIFDVDNCLKHDNGFDCSECKSGYQLQGEACVAGKKTDYTDSVIDVNANDNAAILADYSRSIHSEVEKATVLQAILRKYPNGTDHTIIHYETSAKKYYESVGEFSKAQAFLFELIDFKELPSNPLNVKLPPTIPPVVTPDPPKNSSNSNGGSTQPAENPFGISKINYQYLNFDERNKDAGFIATDGLVRSVNKDALGDKPIVLAAYTQVKGLNKQFYIYYESTDKKVIYESRTIFQLYREKVYIVSFDRTYLR